MASPSRKIVFHMPSLVSEERHATREDSAAGLPVSTPASPPKSPPAAAAPSPLPAEASYPGPMDEGDLRKLATLLEVSQALAGSLSLQTGLYGVLEVLERRCGARRGAITLMEEASGLLVVEAALGYPRTASRVRYRVGEGITGRVAQRGAPEVVPNLGQEPDFLHRAAPREGRGTEDASFLCVAITMEGASAGTLAVEMPLMAQVDAERMIQALRVTAALVSQAVRIHRLVEGERQRLVKENTQLREELRERYEFTNLIGNSGPMRRVYQQVHQVVGTAATVRSCTRSGLRSRRSGCTVCW